MTDDIPVLLERTLDRFSEICREDTRICAAFVGGSIAKGTADRYSDLDLYAIIASEHYDIFFAERREFVSMLGRPVYLEDFNGFGFDLLIFILSTGVKGELGLATEDRFLHIHGGRHRVLLDRKGLLAGVRFPLIQPSPAEVSESLARSMGSFWRYLNLFCVAMGREDLVRASEYFHQARSRLLQVASASEAESAAMSPGVRRSYAQTFFQLERDSMMRAAEEACRLLGRLGRCLGPRHGVDYPDELEKVVRRQLVDLSTSMPHDS